MPSEKPPLRMFRRRWWGVEEPGGPAAAPVSRGEPPDNTIRRPFSNEAYQDQPFGSYGQSAKVDRHAVTTDVRGFANWQNVFHFDCSEFEWGTLVIDCEALSGSDESSDEVSVFPHAEVRVWTEINGQRFVWFIGAIGHHTEASIGGEEKSTGPVVLPFMQGEVPDLIEVEARARRGGIAETEVNAAEVLLVTASARFRR